MTKIVSQTATVQQSALFKQGAELLKSSQSDSKIRCHFSGKPIYPSFNYPEVTGLLKKYNQDALLGVGGFGKVYDLLPVTVSSDDCQSLVIKIIPKLSFLNRRFSKAMLDREAHFNYLTGLSPAEATYEDAENVYVVMRKIEGMELLSFLNGPGGGKPAPKAIDVLLLILNLLHAYEQLEGLKILHLDIKPENIMLTANGEIKFIDFGLAVNYADEATNFKKIAPTMVNSYVVDNKQDGGCELIFAEDEIYASPESVETKAYAFSKTCVGSPGYCKHVSLVDERDQVLQNQRLYGSFSDTFALAKVIRNLLDCAGLKLNQSNRDFACIIAMMEAENIATQRPIGVYLLEFSMAILERDPFVQSDLAKHAATLILDKISSNPEILDVFKAAMARYHYSKAKFALLRLFEFFPKLKLENFSDMRLKYLLKDAEMSYSTKIINLVGEIEKLKPTLVDYKALRFRLASNYILTKQSDNKNLLGWAMNAVLAYVKIFPDCSKEDRFIQLVSCCKASSISSLKEFADNLSETVVEAQENKKTDAFFASCGCILFPAKAGAGGKGFDESDFPRLLGELIKA